MRELQCSDPDFFFWRLAADGQKIKRISLVDWWEDELRPMFQAAKVEMTPHGFRHFRISELLQAGRSVDDVSRMVGTSPAEIRRTYEHWITDDDSRMEADNAADWLRAGLDENGDKVMVQ